MELNPLNVVKANFREHKHIMSSFFIIHMFTYHQVLEYLMKIIYWFYISLQTYLNV